MDSLSLVQLGSFLIVSFSFMLVPLLSLVSYAIIQGGQWFGLIFSSPFYFPFYLGLTDRFPYFAFSAQIQGSLIEKAGQDIVVIRGYDFGVIANTLFVGISTASIATLVGTVLAFIYARYAFPLKEPLRILLLVPLLSTPFVGAVGLRKMLSPDGPLNVLFYEILKVLPSRVFLDGLIAVIFVQTLIFYPIVFLNAYTAFVNVDPSLEEQGENLGAKGFGLFRSVTFPLALPGIEAGAILVFILSIEDLGTPIVFGGIAQKTLTYQIFDLVRNQVGGSFSALASAMTAILLTVSILAFFVIRKYVSLRRYAMLSKGTRWKPRTRRLAAKHYVPVVILILVVVAIGSLPQVSVLLLAFSERWLPGTVLPESFTFKNYQAIFSERGIFGSIVNSLTYSSTAALLIIFIGTGIAYVVARKRIPGRSTLDMMATLPIALPGVVVASGLFFMFLGTPLSPLVNPAPLLIVSYTIRKMPFTVRAVMAGLEQTHVALEEAASNLGANRPKLFTSIVLPLIVMNVFAGAMLSFVYSMSEVSSSLVFGGFRGGAQAPMTWKMLDVLNQLGYGLNPAAALGTILMALQLTAIVISTAIMKGRAGALTGV